MTLSLKPRLLLVWSAVGVPLLFLLFVLFSYRYSLSQGNLPFLGEREWRWYGAFLVAIGSGGACVVVSSSGRMFGRLLLATGYLLLMGSVLFLVSAVVACSQGDCL